MQISDWINVVLCVLSFALAAISVVTVVITLKQNNKMIESSTRPYIEVSYETMTVKKGEVSRYIVLKNYGQTGAVITSMECNVQDQRLRQQICKLVDTNLAPSQRRLYYIGIQDDTMQKPVAFQYTYQANGKTYIQNTSINLISGAQVVRQPDADGTQFLLHEIAERLI